MPHKLQAPEPVYYFVVTNGRYYVYCLQFAPVETLFDIKPTQEEAEQAIKDYKEGKHPTQEVYK